MDNCSYIINIVSNKILSICNQECITNTTSKCLCKCLIDNNNDTYDNDDNNDNDDNYSHNYSHNYVISNVMLYLFIFAIFFINIMCCCNKCSLRNNNQNINTVQQPLQNSLHFVDNIDNNNNNNNNNINNINNNNKKINISPPSYNSIDIELD